MKMHHQSQIRISFLQHCNQPLHLYRIRNPYGITQTACFHPSLHIVLQKSLYSIRIPVFPFKGASECSCQIHNYFHIRICIFDFPERSQRLFMGPVDIGLIMGRAQGNNIADLLQA